MYIIIFKKAHLCYFGESIVICNVIAPCVAQPIQFNTACSEDGQYPQNEAEVPTQTTKPHQKHCHPPASHHPVRRQLEILCWFRWI